jgi:DNA-binding Xre family transcriptional regulator
VSTKAQFLISPSGDELAVLPRADYEELVRRAQDASEDDEDAYLFDARIAELKADPNARLPVAVSAAMLKGDSLLRALRRWRDKTQQQVSAETGLAQGYLSDLESGRKTGTSETLQKIAKALNVEPTWLGA